MPVFLLKFHILDDARSDCVTLFGGMTSEDDKQDMGDNIKLLGRWCSVSGISGYCICDAKTVKDLNSWVLNWSTMATIVATPVVDDNQARQIILGGDEPPFQVDYSHVGDDAKPGEDLYFIEYTFLPNKREAGFAAFAEMTEEQDKVDAGKNTCLGRWHDLGTGRGVAICSSPSVDDLHTWAYKWTSMCDCVIQPVVSDNDLRGNITAKPDFENKRACLVKKMKNVKKVSWWG